ncbi:MAG: CDP-alcohol phosphatidyltransferase family protein [Bacteroides sp.]|nr:CDP-alcohol phosphatidyltransferase family protein [Bacteroides sp.]
MKNLPNIISISRIIISCILFFHVNNPLLFIILYIYCGISDIADGYIARHWKIESVIGAKLDSLGDLIFFLLITFLFFSHTELIKEMIVFWSVVSIFSIKLLNVIITRVKFHQWGMMHTIGNKLSGLFIYFMLPLYILFPATPFIVGIIIVLIALLATFEETLILLTTKEYDLNRKTFLK